MTDAPRPDAPVGSPVSSPGVRSVLRDLGSLALIAVATLVVYAPQAFGGAAFPFDFLGKYTTSPAFVAAHLESGTIPRWANGSGGGMPVLEDPGSGFFYPAWWAAALFRLDLTLNMFAKIQVLHIIAGGVGAMRLAGSRNVDRATAALAGVGFATSGIFFGQAQHANFVRGFSLLPWLLWCVTFRNDDDGRLHFGRRILFLPIVGYLAITGAYPGQLTSFPIIMAVWMAGQILSVPANRRPRPGPALVRFGLATLAAGAFFLAVWGPFASLLGDEMPRLTPGTAAERARNAFTLQDLPGLVVNSFSYRDWAESQSWAVATPILLGLAGLRRLPLRTYLPEMMMAGVAFALAALPSIESIGSLMIRLGPVFTSRFAAADYKVAVVVSLVVLSARGWAEIVVRSAVSNRSIAVGATFVAAMLGAGQLLGGTDAMRFELAAVAIVVCAVVVSIAPPLRRSGGTIAIVLVALLVVADGVRGARESVFAPTESSTWNYAAGADGLAERDAAAGRLRTALLTPPETRPPREAPLRNPRIHPQGTPGDAFGYLLLGYNSQSHGGVQTAAKNLALEPGPDRRYFLREWSPRTADCPVDGCRTQMTIPAVEDWKRLRGVETVRYGQDEITYRVRLTEAALLIENELNFPGWRSTDDRARLVEHDGPFRAWILDAGEYEFTAQFRSGALGFAVWSLLCGLAVWCVLAVIVRRSPDAEARA